MSDRVVVWCGHERDGAEIAYVALGAGGLSAHGTQIGTASEGYRLDYRLQTDESFVTRRLEGEARGALWSRAIDLQRGGDGRWVCEAQSSGHLALAPAGGDMRGVDQALDCDLAFSPPTNLMPVRRTGLLSGPGSHDFVMAWVSVPSLQVRPSEQSYTHLRTDEEGAVIGYVGRHRDYAGDLRFDADGLIRLYPGLAQRCYPELSPADRAAA